MINKIKNMSETVKASFLFTVCGLLQKGISFIIVPIYTRLMPSADYGQYSVFFSWYQIIMIFCTLNMWNYLINNGMTEFKDKRKEFIASLQGLAGIITLGWFIIYLFFYRSWENRTGLTFSMMIIMFTELLTMPSFEFWCSANRYEYKATNVVIATILISILTPIVAIPLILHTHDKCLAAIIGKSGVSIAIYLVVAISMLKKNRKLYSKEYWKYALSFSIPLIPHFLSVIVLQSSDRIMIERMCGASEAAIYSVAYQAAYALQIFNTAILNTFTPYMYRAISEGRFDRIGKKAFSLTLFIGGINLVAALLAPEVVGLLAPAEYQAAIYIIPPVAMTNLLMFMFNLFANIEYYFKETKLIALASIISAIVNVILNYIFIDHYGYIAAGYTTLFCYILFSLCHYFFMRKVSKKHINGKKIFNTRNFLLLAIIFIIFAILITKLYASQFMILRYAFMLVLVIVAIVKRNTIKNMVCEK